MWWLAPSSYMLVSIALVAMLDSWSTPALLPFGWKTVPDLRKALLTLSWTTDSSEIAPLTWVIRKLEAVAED